MNTGNAMIWNSAGVGTKIHGYIPGSPTGSKAWAIDSSGNVVGHDRVGSNKYAWYLASGGTLATILPRIDSDVYQVAYDMNDSGRWSGWMEAAKPPATRSSGQQRLVGGNHSSSPRHGRRTVRPTALARMASWEGGSALPPGAAAIRTPRCGATRRGGWPPTGLTIIVIGTQVRTPRDATQLAMTAVNSSGAGVGSAYLLNPIDEMNPYAVVYKSDGTIVRIGTAGPRRPNQ